MGDLWNQGCSASLLCPLHPGWDPEVAAEGQGGTDTGQCCFTGLRKDPRCLEDWGASWTDDTKVRHARLGWGQVGHADDIWVTGIGLSIGRY